MVKVKVKRLKTENENGPSVKKQVWSTNTCVLSIFFSTLNMGRRTNQQAYLPIEMHFYPSVMFLGLPDDMHEGKTFIFQF